MVDTPSVMFPKSTPLQSAYVCPSTFKHRKAIADENNFLLVLLHKKHTCRPALEARKATAVIYRLPCKGPLISPTDLYPEPSDLNIAYATMHTRTSMGLEPVF